MHRFLNSSLITCLLLAALSCGQMCAQMTTTGSIEGTVMDPSGKAIPAATVTIINDATKDLRSVTSGEAGVFSVTALMPASYTVRV